MSQTLAVIAQKSNCNALQWVENS